jgi:arylsulfatase A
MRSAGYATAIAGKWQLGGQADEQFARRTGFDEHCLWHIPGATRARYWGDPLKFVRNGEVIDVTGEFGPDVFCRFVTDFATRHKDQPFFIYYPMVLTHWPFVRTPDSAEIHNPGQDPPADGHGDERYFGDMVTYADKIVGRILAHLETLGIAENTILLFTGDNGSAGNESKLADGRAIRGAKGKMIDAGTHVPLVAHWPAGAKGGIVCRDLVDFSDFLPTFAAAGGAPLPRPGEIDGRSFLPQLRGRSGDPRETMFMYYRRGGKLDQAKWFARDHRWKLYGDGKLYDLSADPFERKPVADLSDGAAAEAHKRLSAEIAQKVRQFPAGHPTG